MLLPVLANCFGPTLNAEITTGGSTSRTFTASGSFVVEGFTKMDVFLVGGGGGAGYAGEEADILLLNMGFQSLREIMFRLLLEEVADQHLMAVPHLLA